MKSKLPNLLDLYVGQSDELCEEGGLSAYKHKLRGILSSHKSSNTKQKSIRRSDSILHISYEKIVRYQLATWKKYKIPISYKLSVINNEQIKGEVIDVFLLHDDMISDPFHELEGHKS